MYKNEKSGKQLINQFRSTLNVDEQSVALKLLNKYTARYYLFKVNSGVDKGDIRMTSLTEFLFSIVNSEHGLQRLSVVDFEQVNVNRDILLRLLNLILIIILIVYMEP